ncbi:MAG: hypothetical protein KDD53_07350, partial [Bdellovibrionales bacterium]|nr:hypothetical protein [Bdellovibrionales bacterium]
VRVGLMGRRFPGMLEETDETGFGREVSRGGQREVCPGEVGVGLDAFIAGAYVGVCFDEIYDFLLGWGMSDPKNDDIK